MFARLSDWPRELHGSFELAVVDAPTVRAESVVAIDRPHLADRDESTAESEDLAVRGKCGSSTRRRIGMAEF